MPYVPTFYKQSEPEEPLSGTQGTGKAELLRYQREETAEKGQTGMKKKAGKKWCGIILVFCMLAVNTSYAAATQKEIDKTKDEITDLQEQKDEAEEQVDSLNDEKEALESDLSGLNGQLNEIVSSMNKLETEIDTKEQEIETAKQQLAAAEEQSAEQYEAMKIRIQYMYENSGTTVWEMLFESKSVTEFLNRTEYASEVQQYDRDMLVQYQELQQQIAEQKSGLEEELAELVALENQMQEKQDSVNSLIADTRNKIAQSNADIADAEADVESLEAKIAKMEAYEKELEIKKAKEDAARLAKIKEQEKEDTSGTTYVPADSDAYLLGAIIECEAGSEPYEGKLAVGSVIMNRVKSSYFPNTISGVIYQSGQFSPVASGRLAYRLEAGVSSSCIGAAQEVLNGNITTNCLYFRANNGIISGIVIGNHVFY